MPRPSHALLIAAPAAWLLLLTGALAAEKPGPPPRTALPPKAGVDFARRVRPLLLQRCAPCHMGGKQQGGFRLDRREDALRGGDTGPALVPGRSAESLLIRYVTGAVSGKVMPPAGPRLAPAEVSLLRAWIDAGAAWESRGKTDQPVSSHWSFRPIRRPTVPLIRNPQSAIRNSIDSFVLARLQREGIRPSPQADRATLIRRLSLDLLGLPPTPEEVDAFVADRSPDAWEKVVDRLLASPHFGERWGRHWLDLARYADSDGYEKDSARPYAYLYRDWVIDALNRDMPFDRFAVEQLAGDLLPNATHEQRVATGFHRNTLKNREGGADPEEDRVKNTVDRANTTGAVFLGLTVGCAQCHSHKYDPISQREYFGLYAFFNSAQETDIPAATPGEQEKYRQAKAAFDEEHGRLTAAVTAYKAKLAGEPADAELKRLEAAAAEHAKKAPQPPDRKAMTLAEAPAPRTTRIHVRGDFLRPGDEVQPHTPAVLPSLRPEGPAPTRLDLARWIVHPDNPLTPRVTVNRVWQHLFGRGLVGTPDDFGTRGERPTHPELLDWLASWFVRGEARGERREGGEPGLSPLSSLPSPTGAGWSLKSLIRLIVTSEAYRRNSAERPDLKDRDPKNLLLARQNRFRPEAEIVRDLHLAASGLLNREVGGPSIRPPLPADIAALGYAGSVRWQESKGRERYKRGMYVFFQRTVPYPMLATFDAPDSNAPCTRRERSNTPLQALTLLNDPVFFECAQALGMRIVKEAPSAAEQRVRYAFRLCLSREPSPTEAARLLRLYEELRGLAAKDAEAAARLAGVGRPEGCAPAEAAAWVGVARAIMNLDEFLVRE